MLGMQWGLTAAGLLAGGLGWWALLTQQRRGGGVLGRSAWVLIIMAGLMCRVLVALFTPDFYAPDEHSHFNYVKFLAEQHAFPVQQHMTDSPTNDWEYYQPPLYYLAQVPIYQAAQAVFGEQHRTVQVMRLFSIALWGVTMWSAWRWLRALKLRDELLGTAVISMVSLLPSYVFVSSAINNDNMVLCLGSLLLVAMARGDLAWRAALGTGVLLGLAVLAKFSAIVYGVALVAVVLCRQAMGPRQWGKALLFLIIAGVVAGALMSPWIARNLHVYGSATAERVGNVPYNWAALWNLPEVTAVVNVPADPAWLRTAIVTPVLVLIMFLSYWAVSGVHNNVNFVFPVIGLVVACLAWRSAWRLWRTERWQTVFEGGLERPFMLAMMLALAVNMTLVMRFAFLYVQGQGRFLFPLMMPIALLLGVGIRQWRLQNASAHVGGFALAYACAFVGFSLASFPAQA